MAQVQCLATSTGKECRQGACRIAGGEGLIELSMHRQGHSGSHATFFYSFLIVMGPSVFLKDGYKVEQINLFMGILRYSNLFELIFHVYYIYC
jgi:hypothetical protein